MKRHTATWLSITLCAAFVAGDAKTSEAGHCFHWLFHHHHARRAPACAPCAPGGYPGAVSAYYGPRSAYYSPFRSFYGAYSPAVYEPVYAPSQYAPMPTSYFGGDACSTCAPATGGFGYAPACGPSGCPGGVCPPGTSYSTPAPSRVPDELPRYEPDDGADPRRTFEPNGTPSTDEFEPRSPDTPPASDSPEGTGEVEARSRPDVRSPAIPMPIYEPVPARPATPSSDRVRDAEDSNGAEAPVEGAPGAASDAVAPPALRIDQNIAWRAAPVATRTERHATYTRPEVVRGQGNVNAGWTPTARSPQFARK